MKLSVHEQSQQHKAFVLPEVPVPPDQLPLRCVWMLTDASTLQLSERLSPQLLLSNVTSLFAAAEKAFTSRAHEWKMSNPSLCVRLGPHVTHSLQLPCWLTAQADLHTYIKPFCTNTLSSTATTEKHVCRIQSASTTSQPICRKSCIIRLVSVHLLLTKCMS